MISEKCGPGDLLEFQKDRPDGTADPDDLQ